MEDHLDKFRKFLTESKEVKEKKEIKESWIPEDLNNRNNAAYERLVGPSGAAGTVEGEMMRAINRIMYRYYNDGDYFYNGYGTETAGPAQSFLVNHSEIDPEVQRKLVSIFQQAVDKRDKTYEDLMNKALSIILDEVEKMEGAETKSGVDMFDYEAEYEDDTRWEDEEYDEWGEDEEDEY